MGAGLKGVVGFIFQAGLRITLVSGEQSICGASLVSRNRLVTAGHCWYDGSNKAKTMFVVLGSLNIDEKTWISTKDVIVS